VRRLWIVAVFIAALMVTLVVNLTYRQVVQASALRDHPDNTRGLAEEIRQERGAILTADGAILAESVPDGDVFRREYPAGDDAAHVVGYYSTQYGRAGVEAAMNETLTGRREHADLRDLIDAAAGVPVVGDDVWLTIDSRVQTSAEAALEGKVGSVVALDPRSGEILAMASSPSYAPAEVDEEWQELSSAAGAPLVHRATGALYPPGSSFKPVTLTGGLADGAFAQDTVYSGASPMDIGNAPVTNYAGNSYGDVTVREATVRSINTVFGQMAVDLGAGPLVGQARGFGFDSIPPIEIPAEASVMSRPELMTEWELAWAGIGQPVGEHEGPIGPSATPLQMALVAAGIANDGVVMEPHLVGRVTDFGGRTLRTVEPAPWMEATGPATADQVTDIMVEVVESGTGRAAQLPDATVAGKTGTAEIGDDLPTHAWFIAFAPAESPRVAIAVLVEQGGTGGAVAAPLARDVLQTALEVTR
jgi:peptidoglycan glycosyltransferase